MAAGNWIEMKGAGAATEVKQVVVVAVWIFISVFKMLDADEPVTTGVELTTHPFFVILY
jgi:hypothetical protein